MNDFEDRSQRTEDSDAEFEAAIREALNSSAEDLGISVSDELIARTLKAIDAEPECGQDKVTDFEEAKKKRRGIYKIAAGIAAAAFIGVVGLTVIKGMGGNVSKSDNAAFAPMENTTQMKEFAKMDMVDSMDSVDVSCSDGNGMKDDAKYEMSSSEAVANNDSYFFNTELNPLLSPYPGVSNNDSGCAEQATPAAGYNNRTDECKEFEGLNEGIPPKGALENDAKYDDSEKSAGTDTGEESECVNESTEAADEPIARYDINYDESVAILNALRSNFEIARIKLSEEWMKDGGTISLYEGKLEFVRASSEPETTIEFKADTEAVATVLYEVLSAQ